MENTLDNNFDTIIGVHVVVKGNIQNKGSVQLHGTIEGEIRSDNHVDVGETAKVNGPVVAKTVEVSGRVTGLIEASEKLVIKPTGRVIGDINAKSLIIEQGATFVGKSIMPGEKTAEEGSKGETKKQAESTEAEEKPVNAKSDSEDDKEKKEHDPLGFFRK